MQTKRIIVGLLPCRIIRLLPCEAEKRGDKEIRLNEDGGPTALLNTRKATMHLSCELFAY
jgi:hypothetical protein